MHQSVHIPHSAIGTQPLLHTHIQSTQLTAAHLVRMAASSTEFTAERAPRSTSSLLGTLDAARSAVLLAEASVSRKAPCTCKTGRPRPVSADPGAPARKYHPAHL